jgi:hypothetical protein
VAVHGQRAPARPLKLVVTPRVVVVLVRGEDGGEFEVEALGDVLHRVRVRRVDRRGVAVQVEFEGKANFENRKSIYRFKG